MRILVIRRDNIGDLVCTTPLIAELRQRYPKAEIGALVNSYNAEVLRGNPHVDHCFIYKKLKHVGGVFGRFKALLERARLILALRRWKPDITLLAKTGYDQHGLRFARQIGACDIIGIRGQQHQDQPDIALEPSHKGHEVERLMTLLQPLGGIPVTPPVPVSTVADPIALQRAKQAIHHNSNAQHMPILGINLSARLPSQQWPRARFEALIQSLAPYYQIVLFWSPGTATNTMHPGDDEKAAAIAANTAPSVILYPTNTLQDLIAGIAAVDFFISADGGAMHIGAGCHKPTVALFGESNPEQWHPWGVPHTVLRADSKDVSDISAVAVIQALQQLDPNSPQRKTS